VKAFLCKDLGHRCDAVLQAPTEERLVEAAAIHLRDVHGVSVLAPDAVAKIKNLFVNRKSTDAAGVVDRIFEKYNCRREPECTWRYIAAAEMILSGGFAAHERELRAA
jgi:predicted small metal-binding protein